MTRTLSSQVLSAEKLAQLLQELPVVVDDEDLFGQGTLLRSGWPVRVER
jgi:nitrogen fixation protein